MSRIGKRPISIPNGVEIKIEGNKISAKGPKGEISREIRPEIKIELKDKEIFLSLNKKSKKIMLCGALLTP